MAWWGIMLLILALIAGVALGVWGFVSAWNNQKDDFKKNRAERKTSKIKNKIKSVEEMQLKEYIEFDQIATLPTKKKLQGIYSLYVGPEINDKDFFIPIYVVKTDDIIKSIQKDRKALLKATEVETDDVYRNIVDYMEHDEKNSADLRWAILDVIEDSNLLEEKYNEWLIKSKAKDRGFNK